jgi:xanthine dehydrogenase accessory factor
MALGVGLSCGGEIEVLVRPDDPADPVGPVLAASLEDGGAAALLTGVSEDVRGARLLLRPDGTRVGGLGGGGLDASLAEDTSRLLAHEGSRLLDVAAGTVAFLDPVLPPRRLVIVGATPVSEALSRMATLADFRVIVVDPRPELARPGRFPDAEVVSAWPEEALAGLALDPWTSVAVLSHEARLDVPALQAALAAGCRYVGMLGGRRTQRLRRQALAESGVPGGEVERIRGPIGLDIGASTPAEIAVAVLAEIVGTRRGRVPRAP